jgi:hypothetical protein
MKLGGKRFSHWDWGRYSAQKNTVGKSGIAPKQNAFKFNITPHKQIFIVIFIFIFFWQEDT